MPAQNPPAELSMSLTLGGGPTVGRLGFGAMRVSGRGVWGPPPDESEAIALLRRVVDKGVTLIDTACSHVSVRPVTVDHPIQRNAKYFWVKAFIPPSEIRSRRRRPSADCVAYAFSTNLRSERVFASKWPPRRREH
jgi:hypothetical protein